MRPAFDAECPSSSAGEGRGEGATGVSVPSPCGESEAAKLQQPTAEAAYQLLRRDADGGESHSERVAEEVPVAMVYNGLSHVVMMASPTDLEDFTLGFSLTEGIIESKSELTDCEIQ